MVAGPLEGGRCCFFVSTDQALEWSPAGDMIAMIQGPMVWLVKPDGSAQYPLAKGNYFDWSPDGSHLVVTDPDGPVFVGDTVPARPYTIFVINADGTGRRWLSNGEFPAWSPALSP